MEVAKGNVTIELTPGNVSIEQWQRCLSDSSLSLSHGSWQGIEAAHHTINKVLSSGKTVYGINTGFGLLANQRISEKQLKQLQINLVRSHTAGVGDWLDKSIAKWILALKINALAQGYSGVRPAVIKLMLRLFENDLTPCIRQQGSVGASGDLAPLADLASVLIGEGYVHDQKKIITGAEALAKINEAALELAPKEGLSLLNGTQASTAIALSALLQTKRLFEWAIISGAISVDAIKGSITPFDPRIHQVRRQCGQITVADSLYKLLSDSEILASHQACNKIQDPYSLRCQPQVMGACLDQIQHAESLLVSESNAVTDNPLIFSEQENILSGGNFHAEPVAFAADNIALAICEIGSISERRTAQLIDPNFSGLPAFLVNGGGVNSGFMIAQVTAAALVCENKQLAYPASVDSLPTSANQEDHVSMATHGAMRLHRMNRNLAHTIAIELLAGCQGLDFRLPLKTSPKLQKIHKQIRLLAKHYDSDRRFSEDIERITQHISNNSPWSG